MNHDDILAVLGGHDSAQMAGLNKQRCNSMSEGHAHAVGLDKAGN